MTIAASLYAHLTAHPAVAALANDRVYPVLAPQRDPNAPLAPTLVFRLAARRDALVLNGPLTLATTEWEIAALAADYDTAHELAEAVIGTLNYFKGQMGGGVQVEACTLQDAADFDETDLGFFAVLLRFEIQFK